MKKQELIEKAVLAFEGKWLFPYENLVTPSPTNSGYAPYCKFESIKDLLSLGPHWQFVCTYQEFVESAKRMGYINGYRWGVEYPTNGRKPNLNGDVMCLVKFTGRPDFSQVGCVINNWPFDQTSHFKITDQRYKPVSEIAESKPDAVVVSENTESNWFEAGELPPVGTVCEYSLDGGVSWFVCEIRYVVRDVGVVIYAYHLKQEQYCSVFPNRNGLAESKFRPIRTEREKFGLELWKTINYNDKKSDDAILKSSRFEDYCHAYDAGFRLLEAEA